MNCVLYMTWSTNTDGMASCVRNDRIFNRQQKAIILLLLSLMKRSVVFAVRPRL